MNASRPSLLTLVAWTVESAPQMRAWRETSADAERLGELLDEVVWRLDAGEWLGEATAVSPELVSAYLDGSLSDSESRLVEAACLSSPAALGELVSEWRFRRSPSVVEPSRTLEQRLIALVPPPPLPSTSLPVGKSVSVVHPELVKSSSSALPYDTGEAVVPTSRPATGYRRDRRWEHWQVTAMALVVVLTVGSLVAILSIRPPRQSEPDPRVTQDPASPRPSNLSPPERIHPERPFEDRSERLVDRPRASDLAPDSPPVPPPVPENKRSPEPGETVVQTPPLPRPTPPVPASERPVRDDVAQIKLHAELGLLLVHSEQNARWRVAHDSYPLDQPLHLASLDQCWGTAEIPEVGILVYQGETDATLQWHEDGTLSIHIAQGKIGVRDLTAGTRVNVRAGNSQFSAVGVGPYSTMAVVHDPLTPAAFVSSGIIDVSGTQLASNQLIRFTGQEAGAPQPLANSLPTSPFGANPYDPEWLTPPTDRERREWRGQYGKLVERLRASDDVAAALREIRAELKDARQQAVLARWSVTLAENKKQAVWEMLNDRQALVRVAGVERLLELPPRDKRDLFMGASLREAVGDAAADSVVAWLIAAQRSQPLSAVHARDMVERLQHNHLAIRQIAVFLLEHYSAPAFQQARRKPPSYDAAAPANKRAAAQLEWRQIVAQLYAPNRVPARAMKTP